MCSVYICHRKRIFPFSRNPSQSYLGRGQLARQERSTCSQISAHTCLVTVSGLAPICPLSAGFPCVSPDEGACSRYSRTLRTPSPFWESKSKRSLLPECVYIAAALLAGAQALLSSAVRCSCSLTAQKPAPLRGRCVVVGWAGCVSWIASK